MNDYERKFLINYLNNRNLSFGIDEVVKERFCNLLNDIEDIINDGYIFICDNTYCATDLGKNEIKEFRIKEKERHNVKINDIIENAFVGDFVSAYNARVKYEKESIIPHGIGMDYEYISKNNFQINRYIEDANNLDLSDIQNSEKFKTQLRNLRVGISILGERFYIDDSIKSKFCEELKCPNLDYQLSLKSRFKNPNKLYIYYEQKCYNLNMNVKNWDGIFDLKGYDCTDPFNNAYADYLEMKEKQIEGFPKTFQTFYKHMNMKSDKYNKWIGEYNKLIHK